MKHYDTNHKAWNQYAGRYQQNADFSFDVVDYGSTHCATEKDLHLIGDTSGKKVLELGCGGASCGIVLAKQGAEVTGIDISEEQINIARSNCDRENVQLTLLVSSMEELDLTDDTYDIVISMAALGYIEKIENIFKKVYQTLKKNGIFVFSLPDAIYNCVTAKYLWNDPLPQHSYFYTGPEKWKWEDEDELEFVTFRRPISEYINLLIDEGFTIVRVHQLQDFHEEMEGKNEFDQLYPNLIVFKVTKKT